MLNTILYFFLHFIFGYWREPLHVIKQLMCSTPETLSISLNRNSVAETMSGWEHMAVSVWAVHGEGSPMCSHAVDMAARTSIIRQKSDWISTYFHLQDFVTQCLSGNENPVFILLRCYIICKHRTVILMDGLARFCFLFFFLFQLQGI